MRIIKRAFTFFLGKGKKASKEVMKETAEKVLEPMFGGVTQSAINKLVEETPRGIAAVIEEDKLNFIYKSASGKSKKVVQIVFDTAGKLVAYLGNGSNYAASTPRIFLEKLNSVIKSNK